MSTIIIYASSHGAAESSAHFLKDRLDSAAVFDLKKNKNVDIGPYATVIIGGSIHAGQVQRTIKRFLQKNEDTLLEKRLGLYLCCMEEGDTAKEQFQNAFPASLRKHAAATGLFGGRFDFDKMTFIERAIVKKVAGVTESVSKMDNAAMVRFAEAMGA